MFSSTLYKSPDQNNYTRDPVIVLRIAFSEEVVAFLGVLKMPQIFISVAKQKNNTDISLQRFFDCIAHT
jgi:hypothetical protein